MGSGSSDDEWDHTRVGSGERTTSARGVSVVTEGDGESNNLGDGVSLGNGNTDLRRLDVVVAFADTN